MALIYFDHERKEKWTLVSPPTLTPIFFDHVWSQIDFMSAANGRDPIFSFGLYEAPHCIKINKAVSFLSFLALESSFIFFLGAKKINGAIWFGGSQPFPYRCHIRNLCHCQRIYYISGPLVIRLWVLVKLCNLPPTSNSDKSNNTPHDILHCALCMQHVHKVGMPNATTDLNGTPISEWNVVRCGSKN